MNGSHKWPKGSRDERNIAPLLADAPQYQDEVPVGGTFRD